MALFAASAGLVAWNVNRRCICFRVKGPASVNFRLRLLKLHEKQIIFVRHQQLPFSGAELEAVPLMLLGSLPLYLVWSLALKAPPRAETVMLLVRFEKLYRWKVSAGFLTVDQHFEKGNVIPLLLLRVVSSRPSSYPQIFGICKSENANVGLTQDSRDAHAARPRAFLGVFCHCLIRDRALASARCI